MWRAKCPRSGEITEVCKACGERDIVHVFEAQVDRYEQLPNGRLVAVANAPHCPRDGERLVIAGEA